jgi:hypothetical protein
MEAPSMMSLTHTHLLLAVALAGGCSQSVDHDPEPYDPFNVDSGADTSIGNDAAAGVDASSEPDAAPDASPDAAVPVALVVINEIGAEGDDWVEILNAGSEPIDLGDHRVADRGDDGLPRASDALVVPEGTTLAPGGYLFVLADQLENADDWQTECLPDGPSPCLHAGWGISASDGDTIFLLAPNGLVVGEAEYPTSGVDADQTWCRLPDGTGELAACGPSPGSANQAP